MKEIVRDTKNILLINNELSQIWKGIYCKPKTQLILYYTTKQSLLASLVLDLTCKPATL